MPGPDLHCFVFTAYDEHAPKTIRYMLSLP
jgi:hypothetical protein